MKYRHSVIWKRENLIKYINSEKAIKFCKISILDLSYVVMVKSTVEIFQNFVAFSEYMNYNPNGQIGSDFGSWIFIKNFFEVKIDINRINLMPYQAHSVL